VINVGVRLLSFSPFHNYCGWAGPKIREWKYAQVLRTSFSRTPKERAPPFLLAYCSTVCRLGQPALRPIKPRTNETPTPSTALVSGARVIGATRRDTNPLLAGELPYRQGL